ncbi:MAG TPA: hypothetical protein PKI11_16930 [Candidatus Hydrogenedentes bacterium]|nr:hypothetical protein [Candidatus Hydrogenedentota bacterium]HNT88369.1 hypothetical protein [Candidatus Hydrogenedentota bacterium]
MIFVKTFKGYEDRTAELDKAVNAWVLQHNPNVVSIRTALAHEPEGRARTGDLIYTIVYKADQPLPD